MPPLIFLINSLIVFIAGAIVGLSYYLHVREKSVAIEKQDSIWVAINEMKAEYEETITDLSEEIIKLKQETKQVRAVIDYGYQSRIDQHYWTKNREWETGLLRGELTRINKKISALPLDTLRIGDREFPYKYPRISIKFSIPPFR